MIHLMPNKIKLASLMQAGSRFNDLSKLTSSQAVNTTAAQSQQSSHSLSTSSMYTSSFTTPSALMNSSLYSHQIVRHYSQKPKTFFGGFIEQIREEFSKNKEMKESIDKFREEAKKLEQSDALKEARKKYKEIEDETDKNSQVFKQRLGNLAENFKESDLGKKTAEFTDEFSKQAHKTAESLREQTQELSKTAAFKKVSEGVKNIKDNIDDATQLSQVKPYQKPTKLRKRSEIHEAMQAKIFESNTEATGMVLHKDSKFYQSWQNFKDNNTYINKLFDLKTQIDESDNPFIRVTRSVTDKFTSVFGSMFKSTEMSEVLTEIVKVEPTFEINAFLKRVQLDIIPNIMESVNQGELEILKDWCTEVAYTVLSHSLTQCKQLNLIYHNEILDVRDIDIVASKLMDQGPVLIIRFVAQQIIYVEDKAGKVVEGDKNKIKRCHHVWALCRDQTILDPDSAWRLMECGIHQADDMVL